jgi:hypothetical protein
VAEAFGKVLKAAVISETITVSKKIVTIINISYYLHNKRSVIFITNQVTGQQNTLLKSKSKLYNKFS